MDSQLPSESSFPNFNPQGGYALMKAAEHRPDMAQRLRVRVQERVRQQLAPEKELGGGKLEKAEGK